MGGGVPHLIRVCNAGRADVETTIQSPLPQKQEVCAAFVCELNAVCGFDIRWFRSIYCADGFESFSYVNVIPVHH